MRTTFRAGHGIHLWPARSLTAPVLEAAAKAVCRAFGQLKAQGRTGAEFLLRLASLVRDPHPALLERQGAWYALTDVAVLPVSPSHWLVSWGGRVALAEGSRARQLPLQRDEDFELVWCGTETAVATILTARDRHPVLEAAAQEMEQYRLRTVRFWGRYPSAWAELLDQAGRNPRAYITRVEERGCTNEMCGHCSHDPAAPIWEICFPEEWFVYVDDLYVNRSGDKSSRTYVILRPERNLWRVREIYESSERGFHDSARLQERVKSILPQRLNSGRALGEFLQELLNICYGG